MVHNPVKLSSVASRIHSLFLQVKNYECGTWKIWKISLNMIMMGPRALMFLSSICRHNEHLSFVFKPCHQELNLCYLFLPIDIKSLSFLINRFAKSALKSSNAGRFWSQFDFLNLLHLSCHSRDYDLRWAFYVGSLVVWNFIVYRTFIFSCTYYCEFCRCHIGQNEL